MTTTKFLAVLCLAVSIYTLSLRRRNIFPRPSDGTDYIDDSYLHSMFHLFHFEVEQESSTHQAKELRTKDWPSTNLKDAMYSVDTLLAVKSDHLKTKGAPVPSPALGTDDQQHHIHLAHDQERLAEVESARMHDVRSGQLQLRGDIHMSNAAQVDHEHSSSDAVRRQPFKRLRGSNTSSKEYFQGGAKSQIVPSERASVPKPTHPLSNSPLQHKALARVAPTPLPQFQSGAELFQPAEQTRYPCGQFGVWRQERCICNRLHTGAHCEQHVDLSAFKILQKVQKDFKGAITMSKHGLTGKRVLRVFLPGKESDPDKGNRVLGRVTAGLIAAVQNQDIFKGKIFEKCAVVGSSGILHHFQL